MAQITLIRHGETHANVAQLLQGRDDSPLTDRGRAQLARVRERLIAAEEPFDLVVGSPQGRAVASAEALGFDGIELDDRLVEGDPGLWEGLTREQIIEGFPDDAARLHAGEDIPIGGGERRSDVGRRALAVVADVARRVGPDGRALLVTHGGVVGAATVGVLRSNGRWPLARVVNTSLTRIAVRDGQMRLEAFNDDRHLQETERDGFREPDGSTHVILIRHGRTEANAAGEWQGQRPGVLDETGRAQAEALVDAVPKIDVLYSSDLQRAIDTAAPLAKARGLDVHTRDDLREISMGEWEGMHSDDIQSGYPELWARLYDHDEDLPRGVTGETFAGVAARMRAALDEIVAAHAGKRVGIVSHGGSLRALLGTVVGFGFAGRVVVPSMANTAMTRLVCSPRTGLLATFNTAP